MPLDYAPPQRLPLWRRHRRLLITILVAMVVGIIGLRYGPRYWQTARLFLLQRRALSYVAPDDCCVLRQEITNSKQVEAPGSYTWKNAWSVPPAWGDYLSDVNASRGPALFVGCRTNANGVQRIVVVQSASGFGTAMNHPRERVHPFAVIADVLAPGGLTSAPVVVGAAHTGLCGEVEPVPALQLYAGHADPDNRSHFTIVYQVGSQRGTIDGYLQNDDTVQMQIRDGPATGGVIDPF